MRKYFGTDGIRRIANTELTPELVYKVAKAGAYVLSKHTDHAPTILIGRDTRISGTLIESAMVAGFLSYGANVKLLGVIPTPAVAYLTRKMQADASVVISASHNTFEFNGIKYFSNKGMKIPDELEEEIEEDKKDGGKVKTDSAVNDTVSKDYPKKNSIDTTDKTEVKKDIDEADTLSRIGKAELHRPDAGQRKKMFADLMGQVEKLDNNTETSLQYSKENQAAENINITKNRPDILEDDNLSQNNFTASDKKNTGLNSESVQQDDKSDKQQTQALKEETKSDDSFNGMAASKNLDMLHEKAAYNIKQETLFETGVLKEDRTKDIRIVGQVFSTYWILQYEDSMYMVDQHAAHEKVLYERFMKQIAEHKPMVQMVNPPIVLSLSMLEQQMVDDNIEVFDELGYKIESFGGREYIVTGIPAQLPDIATTDLLMEIIDDLANGKTNLSKDILLERVATMSCKAAVKGNNELPLAQAQELLKELMSLENPYNCPHGRPTMIRMSKYELEKKFKRVV